MNELDKNNINKYTLIKSDKNLEKIKNNILKNQSDNLEWLNIERKGMKYIINIEPKIDKNKTEKKPYCNIISKKDATISRIIASSGVELKEINDYVKKGEIIISGDVSYNDNTTQVCANGEVYGHTWYTINITLPKTHEIIKRKNNHRYNITIKHHNTKTLIFRPRLKEYIMEHKKIFNLLGYEFLLSKEISIEKEIISYTNEELEVELSKLVKTNLSKTLEGDFKIIDQKVLKKSDNNSTIEVELFIVAEEKISAISYEPLTP